MSRNRQFDTKETLFCELLSHLGFDAREGSVLPPAIRSSAQSVIKRVEGAHPELDVDLAKFLEHLAEKILEGVSSRDSSLEALKKALHAVHVEDLYLAFGCATEVPLAVNLFERRFAPYIEQVCRNELRRGVSQEDMVQVMRMRLFVSGEGKKPLIANYAGRGTLKSWLYTVISRAIVDEYRRHQKLMEQLTDLVTATPSPEIEYFKEKYRADFSVAFQDSVQALTSQERNLLRLYVRQHVTLQQLATCYGVDRSTVIRRLAKIRKKLLSTTRRALVAKLECRPDEISSILRFIESRMDVSFNRMLSREGHEDA